VSRDAVAVLTAFKLAHPLWAVTRAGTSLRAFEARKGGLVIRAASLGELAKRIRVVELHPPG